MKRTALPLFLTATVLLHSGCSMKGMATSIIAKIGTDGMIAIEDEEDVELARETSLPLIKTFEVIRHGNPNDVRALALLSKSYGQYAFAFLEQDMLRLSSTDSPTEWVEQNADLFYRRGKEYGIAALSRHRRMRHAFKSSFSTFDKAVDGLGKKYVPALFWTAFNWANLVNLHRDDPDALVNLPRIQAMIDRVIELDPDYNYGLAHAFRGVMAASRPKVLGGDPHLAHAEFMKAIEMAPDYLMTKVLFAQYYARQVADAELFRRTLSQVIGADIANLPEQRLANELAKQRAQILLDMEEKLF